MQMENETCYCLCNVRSSGVHGHDGGLYPSVSHNANHPSCLLIRLLTTRNEMTVIPLHADELYVVTYCRWIVISADDEVMFLPLCVCLSAG